MTPQTLYDRYPRFPSGAIGTLIPEYISNTALEQQARRMGLTGTGIPTAKGSTKKEADTLETFVGVVYEDNGFEVSTP